MLIDTWRVNRRLSFRGSCLFAEFACLEHNPIPSLVLNNQKRDRREGQTRPGRRSGRVPCSSCTIPSHVTKLDGFQDFQKSNCAMFFNFWPWTMATPFVISARYRAILYERNYYDIFFFDMNGNLIYSVFKVRVSVDR